MPATMTTARLLPSPAIRSQRERDRKAYNRQAQAEPGSTAFPDAELAEGFGSLMRLRNRKHIKGGYPEHQDDVHRLKALGISENAIGGATVPAELLPYLIEQLDRSSAFRSAVGTTMMSREVADIPRQVGDCTAEWLGESMAANPADPTFDDVSMSAKKLGAFVRVANELLRDSALNIGETMARLLTAALGRKEDQAAVNGDGTSTYGGNVGLVNKLDSNAIHTTTNTTWALLTWTDIMAMFAKLDDVEGADGEMVGFCSHNFLAGVVARLHNGVVYRELWRGRPAYRVGGILWHTCAAMPKTIASHKIACFGGFFSAGAKFSQTGDINLADAGERYFEHDQTVYRAVERVDINIHETGASGNPIVIAALKTT